ncbi:hypothetical protein ABPG72_022012 [Tetrahymena utriculariae]
MLQQDFLQNAPLFSFFPSLCCTKKTQLQAYILYIGLVQHYFNQKLNTLNYYNKKGDEIWRRSKETHKLIIIIFIYLFDMCFMFRGYWGGTIVISGLVGQMQGRKYIIYWKIKSSFLNQVFKSRESTVKSESRIRTNLIDKKYSLNPKLYQQSFLQTSRLYVSTSTAVFTQSSPLFPFVLFYFILFHLFFSFLFNLCLSIFQSIHYSFIEQ